MFMYMYVNMYMNMFMYVYMFMYMFMYMDLDLILYPVKINNRQKVKDTRETTKEKMRQVKDKNKN